MGEEYNYRIYEHVIGLPDYLDTPLTVLEDYFFEMGYTAEQAEQDLKKNENIYNEDRFGRKIRLYVYRY